MSMIVNGLSGEALVNQYEMAYLLKCIPEAIPSIVVEIGTYHGVAAAHLAAQRPLARIISIDPFPPRTPENVEAINHGDVAKWVENRRPNQMLFVGTAQQFTNTSGCSFANAVFVDGDRRAPAVLADLRSASAMVAVDRLDVCGADRQDGVIFCHDYGREGPNDSIKLAVDQFCREYNFRIADKCSTIVKVVQG